MTSEEIRAAMEWATWRQTSHVYAETLAAAVRELYDALREYHDIWPDIDHEANADSCKACAVLARYRVALEDVNDE